MDGKLRAAARVDSLHIPPAERVLDRLGDILFACEEIIDTIASERSDTAARAIETAVRRVYDDMNELMKQFAD